MNDSALETTVAASNDTDRAIAEARARSRTTVLPRRTAAPRVAAEPCSFEPLARYEQVATLGEGGVGEVTLAIDHDIERKVALKRLRQPSPSALLRFAEEARIVGRLEHPSIVPVHDVGVDELGRHYLVMKFVHGETLETILEKLKAGDSLYEARFTHEHRARIFRAIVEAVRYAHDRGVIHRDLKPANVMVGPYGEVTVMDWGIAKPVGDADPAAPGAPDSSQRLVATQEGTCVGTPLYMSPEQAAGKNAELDAQSDIFSLCVMFFELLTLRHPLGEPRTVFDVVDALVHRDIAQRDLVRVAVAAKAPCEYVYLLAKGLARDPRARFASLAELEAGLHEIERGKIPVTCPITATKRAGHELVRWVDRHGRLVTMLFALGVLGAAAALAFVAARLIGVLG